jgi:hypothetical protein
LEKRHSKRPTHAKSGNATRRANPLQIKARKTK